MTSLRQLTIQLLCTASIFMSYATHTSPLRFALRRGYSSIQSSAAHATEKTVVSLDPITNRMLDEIYKNTSLIRNHVAMNNSKNKIIALLSVITLGQAAYIINDKDTYGIATTIKNYLKTLSLDAIIELPKPTNKNEVTEPDSVQKKDDKNA